MRVQDNISTFLETVKQQSPQPQAAAAEPTRQVNGSAVQRILGVLAANANGMEIGALYKETTLDFSQFAEALEKLKKLDGIRVVKSATGETAFPGPNADVLSSLA